jgi:hypothetical protein
MHHRLQHDSAKKPHRKTNFCWCKPNLIDVRCRPLSRYLDKLWSSNQTTKHFIFSVGHYQLSGLGCFRVRSSKLLGLASPEINPRGSEPLGTSVTAESCSSHVTVNRSAELKLDRFSGVCGNSVHNIHHQRQKTVFLSLGFCVQPYLAVFSKSRDRHVSTTPPGKTRQRFHHGSPIFHVFAIHSTRDSLKLAKPILDVA